MSDDLTQIADALERNTAALEAILQRVLAPYLQAAYERGRADERANIINRVHELAFSDEEGNLWGVYDFIVGIREEEHVGEATP